MDQIDTQNLDFFFRLCVNPMCVLDSELSETATLSVERHLK